MSESEARVAVVTGARRGLGYEVARVLAERGYRVVLTARTLKKAQPPAARLSADCGHVVAAALDVGSDASVGELFSWIDSTFGRIDVLVNNAGTIFESELGRASSLSTLDVPAELVLRSIDNNAIGAYRTSVPALRRMNRARYGRIVNVSSGMGALSDMGSGFPAYRISKTALHGVTRVLSHECAANVKLNAVCPGWVRTEMGGQAAERSIAEGAQGIVWAALLPDDGPSGGFFRDGEPIDW